MTAFSRKRLSAALAVLGGSWAVLAAGAAAAGPTCVLQNETFRHYVDEFNRGDRELYAQHIPNSAAWDFLKDNIPLLDCPDPEIQQIYYFRWWTFRKHVKQTPAGFVITEFLPPVGWSGKYNTINCAAGHHLREGRWLADPHFLDDYTRFWFRGGGNVRAYSCWIAEAIWSRFLVTGDDHLLGELLPDLTVNYEAWEKSHRDRNGLFWQSDDRDGMEVSIGGSGYRATLNSYMFGDALAIARMAERFGQKNLAVRYHDRAAELKRLVEAKLWDRDARFFKVLPRTQGAQLRDVRELHGYTPWYFDLPDADKSLAWEQLFEPGGFAAPFGPTTAERRHPRFALAYQGHECQWNGPSWPFATAVTLTAMANLLNDYRQSAVGRKDYFNLLKTYTRAQHLRRDDGSVAPWIDENLNPLTGDWISRTRLKTWRDGKTWDPAKGGEERGKDYNHSTYCDLIISGLVGLRPQADQTVVACPLVPEGAWDYFCLDGVRYHGRWLTILWDKTGERYHRGRGLRIFVDGRQVAAADGLERLVARLPPAAGENGAANGGADSTSGPPLPPGEGRGEGNLRWSRELETQDPHQFPLTLTLSRRERGPGTRSSQEASDKVAPREKPATGEQTAGGWVKYEGNPVLGGKYGTCFDVSVLREGGTYRMWLSWRPKQSIALVESRDGIHWSHPPRIVLGPRQETGWEDDINRPAVVRRPDGYHLWYTGQAGGHSRIGYATSPDGIQWKRMSGRPVLVPDQPWEKVAVMCPHCLWDEQAGRFRLWYSGGEQYEPDAIGYATSRDGLVWSKQPGNPVFSPDRKIPWEQERVTACQVERRGDWHLMFYIGFRDREHAQIGLARSKDGITGWQRHPANPIVRAGQDRWDGDACYKPFAIFDGRKWLLWYNGRRGGLEQIGLVLHAGQDLGFDLHTEKLP